MLIVHIALQAGLLPSQQVVDRRIVDMKVADQVEGDTLCSVMQRVASLTESDGKTKDFVALARNARRSKPGLGERLDFDEIEPRGVKASAVERFTGQDRKVGGTGISIVITRSATAAQALEAVISADLGGADVIASRAAPRSSRTATAAKALAADTSADAGVGDVVAPRAVQRSTGTATAAKTLAADTSAELGDGDVVASLPASPSTWTATAAKALAADTSAVF
ncbi:hypothetical protein I4F81_007539 [Pyropia yezoensis]|uniref:Uncharacterized protein n=1 Tax=Pyropia yezoensis TaxID=2788 RepID=A0ACC3C558_PYRYE|nr:hypothetical protein I4F81_007539 [Neopyropia yezoensis]